MGVNWALEFVESKHFIVKEDIKEELDAYLLTRPNSLDVMIPFCLDSLTATDIEDVEEAALSDNPECDTGKVLVDKKTGKFGIVCYQSDTH